MALRNLNFTLQGDRYVAEETVNADYALHLERKAGGGLVQSRPVHRLVFRPWRLSDAHQD